MTEPQQIAENWIQDNGNDLVGHEYVSGVIAETNAEGYAMDYYKVLEAEFTDKQQTEIDFSAEIWLVGEQDEEAEYSYCGNTVIAVVECKAVKNRGVWEVDEEVTDCYVKEDTVNQIRPPLNTQPVTTTVIQEEFKNPKFSNELNESANIEITDENEESYRRSEFNTIFELEQNPKRKLKVYSLKHIYYFRDLENDEIYLTSIVIAMITGEFPLNVQKECLTHIGFQHPNGWVEPLYRWLDVAQYVFNKNKENNKESEYDFFFNLAIGGFDYAIAIVDNEEEQRSNEFPINDPGEPF